MSASAESCCVDATYAPCRILHATGYSGSTIYKNWCGVASSLQRSRTTTDLVHSLFIPRHDASLPEKTAFLALCDPYQYQIYVQQFPAYDAFRSAQIKQGRDASKAAAQAAMVLAPPTFTHPSPSCMVEACTLIARLVALHDAAAWDIVEMGRAAAARVFCSFDYDMHARTLRGIWAGCKRDVFFFLCSLAETADAAHSGGYLAYMMGVVGGGDVLEWEMYKRCLQMLRRADTRPAHKPLWARCADASLSLVEVATWMQEVLEKEAAEEL